MDRQEADGRMPADQPIARRSLLKGAAAGAVADVAPDVRSTRLGPGRVVLRWNAATHPMLMVRDPTTGQVMAFGRGGQAELATDRTDLDVQLSAGVGGWSVRVAVPR